MDGPYRLPGAAWVPLTFSCAFTAGCSSTTGAIDFLYGRDGTTENGCPFRDREVCPVHREVDVVACPRPPQIRGPRIFAAPNLYAPLAQPPTRGRCVHTDRGGNVCDALSSLTSQGYLVAQSLLVFGNCVTFGWRDGADAAPVPVIATFAQSTRYCVTVAPHCSAGTHAGLNLGGPSWIGPHSVPCTSMRLGT